jgi:hypothetical protein
MLSIDTSQESSSTAKWNSPGFSYLDYAEKWVMERVCTIKETICQIKEKGRQKNWRPR